MATKVFSKKKFIEILEKQLTNRAKKNQYGIVFVGSATDAYMPHEKELKKTEAFLKLFLKYRFPIFISTKRDLILRDIELLKEIDRAAILPDDLKQKLNRGVILAVSVSTMNSDIAESLEPGAILPEERMKLIQQLKSEGFLAGVNAIPVLPFISDTEEELEKIISTAKTHQADFVLTGGLTLFGDGPADSKTLYFKFLERKFPHLISNYHQLYQNKFYPPFWYQEELEQRASFLCGKYGIRNKIPA
ncbi:MAG: radical SAM protein [Chitinophagales bacterium]